MNEEKLKGIFAGANFNGAQVQLQIGDYGTMVMNESGKGKGCQLSGQKVVEAVEKVVAEGLFYAGTAWAVVFKVLSEQYELGQNQSEFVRYVRSLPFSKRLPYEITLDGVSKPLRESALSDKIEKWEVNGVREQPRKLAKRLIELLG